MHLITAIIADEQGLIEWVLAPGNDPVQSGPDVGYGVLWDSRRVIVSYQGDQQVVLGENIIKYSDDPNAYIEAVRLNVVQLLETGQSFVTQVGSGDQLCRLRWTVWVKQVARSV